jgi:hypothetical protein
MCENTQIVKKTFKVYTTTLKSCLQNAYHLASFNTPLVANNDSSKYIREEVQVQKDETEDMIG